MRHHLGSPWEATITRPSLGGPAATDASTRRELESNVRDLIVLYTDRDKRMPYRQAVKDFEVIWDDRRSGWIDRLIDLIADHLPAARSRRSLPMRTMTR